jgi:hypothetical protein
MDFGQRQNGLGVAGYHGHKNHQQTSASYHRRKPVRKVDTHIISFLVSAIHGVDRAGELHIGLFARFLAYLPEKAAHRMAFFRPY